MKTDRKTGARKAAGVMGLCAALASCSFGGRPFEDRTVDLGSHRLAMRVIGCGSPAVVIDAGLGDGMDELRTLQERLGRATRVIAYNRAGYGLSEPGPLPRDAGREAGELKALLDRAGEKGPFVLVGHSLGALNMMIFASLYPDEVAGMALLDPPPLSFIQGQIYTDLGRTAEGMTADWQAAADSGAASADAAGRASASFLRMIASEHREMFGASAGQAAAVSSFGRLPLVVIASGVPNPAFGSAAGEFQAYWIAQSRALAGKSGAGRFVLAEKSSHRLYEDVPEVVAREVESVVAEARAKGAGGPSAGRREVASIVARCAEAMGGTDRIKAIKGLRLEVVYPDHDATPVLHEIRRPNRIRTERPGSYAAVFDGARGLLLKYDPAQPGRPPVLQDLPAGAARGFETDLVWFVPAFLDFPAEDAGAWASNGVKCRGLAVMLPLGTRAVYGIDARTSLIKTIAVDEVFEGRTFHMEREWLDYAAVQGILYPRRMTYRGRNGDTAVAEIRRIEFNPVLGDDRFRLPAEIK